MMNAKLGRKRTTSGLWISNENGDAPSLEQLLILDVEGVDSRERHPEENIKAFENRATLFSLAMSSVLIINLFEHDVGLHHGACLPLLQTVFSSMLRLDGKTLKRGKKLLFFILRDYGGVTPIDKHRKTCVKAMNHIWEGIPKDGDKAGLRLEDLFDLEVYGLADIVPDGGLKHGVLDELRQCFFEAGCATYVFRGREGQMYDDARELARLAEAVWKQILGDRDLDVESDRVLLAKARCQEAYDGVMEGLRRSVDALYLELDRTQGAVDLRPKAQGLVKMGIRSFEVHASRYDQAVYAERRASLGAAVQRCYDDFARQVALVQETNALCVQAAQEAAEARRAVEALEDKARESERMRARYEEEKAQMEAAQQRLDAEVREGVEAERRGRIKLAEIQAQMAGADEDMRKVLELQERQIQDNNRFNAEHNRRMAQESERSRKAVADIGRAGEMEKATLKRMQELKAERDAKHARWLEREAKRRAQLEEAARNRKPQVIHQSGGGGGGICAVQ